MVNFQNLDSEENGVVVSVNTNVLERYPVRITTGIPAIPTFFIMFVRHSRKFLGSSQSALRHDRLFSNPFQFFTHKPSYHRRYSLDILSTP